MKQDIGSELRRVALDAVENLEGVNTVLDAAKYVPVQYFGVMAGKDAPDYKDGTFIVQKSNIVAIKRYVRSGLDLPVNLSDVERLLGYTQIDIDGLEPADIQGLHQKIHQHALSWGTLERDTKGLGSRLDLFSRGFINTGTEVIKHLQNTEGYRNLRGTIDTLTPSELEALAAIPLGNSDTETVRNMEKFLVRMKNDIESFYDRISSVKALATEFSRKITEELLPAVDSKLKRVDEGGIEHDTREQKIRNDIKDLDQHIAEKLVEYDSLVGYAFTGLVFGPIGVAITGGIFGSKAEQVRAEKNELIARREELLEKLHARSLPKLFSELSGKLINTRSLMGDAEQGARNLEDVWAIIWVSVEESLARVSDAASVLDLNLLVLDFQAVVEPWKVIKGHANALSKVFNEVAD